MVWPNCRQNKPKLKSRRKLPHTDASREAATDTYTPKLPVTPGVCGSQPCSPGNGAAPSFLSELPLLTLTRIFCYPSSWDPLTMIHSAISSSAVPPPSTIDAVEKAGGLVDQSPDRFFPFSVQGGFAFQPHFPQNTAPPGDAYCTDF